MGCRLPELPAAELEIREEALLAFLGRVGEDYGS